MPHSRTSSRDTLLAVKWSTALLWGGSALAVFGAWRYSRAQARCGGELLTKLPGRWDAQRLRPDHPWLMPEADVLALLVLVIGILILTIAVPRAQEIRDARVACVHVLRCLDGGSTREQCDELFPSCVKVLQ